MAALDADIWVCGECRSINARRAKQCYRCRTPRDVAAVDPSQIEGTGHGKLREVALPEFHASRGAALLASALLIFLAVMQIVSTVTDAILLGRVVRNPGLLVDPAFAGSTESLVAGTVAIAALGVALLALIAWAFWLSRAVMAMPALGLGYPAANGLMAFVENFLPGLNLFRVPAIVRDVMRRLEPESLRGEALIFAAWIGLLGGYLVPRLGAYLGLFSSDTLEDAVRVTLIVQAVSTALVVVGATFLVALIWWIERRIERRRAAQLAGEPAPAAGVAGAAPGSATQGAPVLGDPRLTAQPASAEHAGTDLSSAASDPPIDEDRIVEPVGSIASRADMATFASRSITAATGPASTPPEVPAAGTPTVAPAAISGMPTSRAPTAEVGLDRAPAPSEMPPAEQAPAADQAPPAERSLPSDPALRVGNDAAIAVERSPAAPEPPIESGPAVESEVPPAAGPQLHLRVEAASSMIATMDGESEPITLDDLRAAAEALARANGSAVIATDGTSFGALSVAEQAFEILTDAGVVTTVEE